MSASTTKYLLDTNILINLGLWLPVSLNKPFWLKLEESLAKGGWVLLDVVVGEVKYNDDLIRWCKDQSKKGLVKNITINNRERAVEINNAYRMIDQSTQKSTVDTYLIAYAEEHGLTIFSREGTRKMSTDLYKIPDVCDILKIKYMKTPKVFYDAIGYRA